MAMKKCLFTVIVFILLSYNKSFAQTTLYVGSAETYTTIAAAYAACTSAGTNYIIEVKSTYANAEAKPITFAANTAASIIIRPHSTIASVLTISTGSAASVFSFTAGDNITIDGRIGSTGSTSLFTIENTQAAASKYAIQFSGGSTGNTIKYCTVKGSNTSSNASSTAPGVIMFSSGTNSNNTIANCIIMQSGSNYPAVCINSYDATNNNQISITNCSIVNFTYYGIWANGANNDNWTITGNSLYADYAQSGWTNVVYMLHIADGTDYTITGNYFGGRDVSCGGSAYTLNSNQAFHPIYINDCDAGTITISGNYIQNIAFTCTLAGNQWAPFYVAAGAANFTIGSSGNGNTIGATSGAGNIICTDNATNSASAIQNIIGYILSTGTTSIRYNTVGAITFNGSNINTGKRIYGMYLGDGTVTFSDNTVGNSTADNIILSPNSGAITYIIYVLAACDGTSTINNNIICNIDNNAAAGDYKTLYALNQLSCNTNSFFGLSSASNYSASTNSQGIISFTPAESVSITNNIIKAITFSSSSSLAHLIYINNTSASVTCTSNTIGETNVSNDITLSGNTFNIGLYFNDCGDITCTSNTIQNIHVSSTGTESRFVCCYTGSSSTGNNSFSSNLFDNITCAGTGTFAIHNNYYLTCGFYYSGGGTTSFTLNVIADLESSTTSSTCDLWTAGIFLRAATGTITMEKNRITGLTHKGTIGTNSARIVGIRSSATGNTNSYNNVILLNNGSNTNYMQIEGFYFDATSGTGTHNFYHNTVKISGTTSGTATRTAWFTTATTGTYIIRNNIFQNVSTGGTGLKYAIQKTTTGTTWTETNNYLEASTIGNWEGTTKTTFALWQGVSGTNDKNSTITLNSLGAVPSASSGDVLNTGYDLSPPVSDDFDANSRHATTPWIGAYETTTPLPVELISFYETCYDNMVTLHWETASELNNNYFSIEKTIDGVNWKKIGLIPGAGFSQELRHYSFTETPEISLYSNSTTVSYYRLKQVDFNGEVNYSPVIAHTNCQTASHHDLSVFPIPADNYIIINGINLYSIKIFSVQGQVVKEINTSTSSHTHEINVDELPPGIYLLIGRFEDNTFVSRKWLKK